MTGASSNPLVAIACGGTGGHLFPGLAVGEALVSRHCQVLLIISPKDIDQQAAASARGMDVFTLPAVALSRGRLLMAARGFVQSLRAVRKLFQSRPPRSVLAMGGFTSVAPVLAGKMGGAATFLHESNTIPGKANRWLSHIVDQAFVGFPSAAHRLAAKNVVNTGTPVRPQFDPGDPAAARMALGLDPHRPVLLVMGGSQGAAGINELMMGALPGLSREAPEWQYLHLTGDREFAEVRAHYPLGKYAAVVRPFLTEMELGMAAATLAVCRAGASSLAELAAMRLPAILIPFPAAADNHQLHNARALADAGAGWLLEQRGTTPEKLAAMISQVCRDEAALARVRAELVRWHSPRAAELIAEKMLLLMQPAGSVTAREASHGNPSSSAPTTSMHKMSPPSMAA